MNVLHYGNITMKIKANFDWRDIPGYTDFLSRNSYLNIILSLDNKGVSNLYYRTHIKSNQILGEVTKKWKDKAQINLISIKLSRSFLLHNYSF